MKQQIIKELEQIRKSKGGLLRPEDVVEFAKNEATALHTKFEWDDTEAARRFRLEQARDIISVVVKVHKDTGQKVRAYVSLSTDRNPNGGYRAIAEVLSDDDMRGRLLDDALNELNTFKRRYETLRKIASLEPVFVAIDEAIAA